MKLIKIPIEAIGPELERLEALLFDNDKRLRSVPAAELQKFEQFVISAFCAKHGYYSLLTDEMIDMLRPFEAGRRAIEIGSGEGHLARALGIPATDLMIQTDEMASFNEQQVKSLGVPNVLLNSPIRYGTEVERLDYMEAIKKHRPEVVVACSFIHKYDERRPMLNGSVIGLDLRWLVEHVPLTVMCYNAQTYQHHNQPVIAECNAMLYRPLNTLFSRSFENRYNTFMLVTKGNEEWANQAIRDFVEETRRKQDTSVHDATDEVRENRKKYDDHFGKQPDYSRQTKQN